MKALCVITTLACIALSGHCGAQTNLPLTNYVLINEDGMRLSVATAESLDRNDVVGDKDVLADGEVFWLLHNTSTY